MDGCVSGEEIMAVDGGKRYEKDKGKWKGCDMGQVRKALDVLERRGGVVVEETIKLKFSFPIISG